MSATRILTNICSAALPQSRDFYISLLDFELVYESDWYVQLRSSTNAELEIGVISRTSGFVPHEFLQSPTGVYLTFRVPDVDAVYTRACRMRLRIMQELRNEHYGRRRFLTRDPNGCLIDVSSPWVESPK